MEQYYIYTSIMCVCVVTVVMVILLRDFDLSFILSVNTKLTNNLKYGTLSQQDACSQIVYKSIKVNSLWAGDMNPEPP
jgi:hypothetical protein